MERYQVIIVGGGPVGMALAVDLGLRGISCAVVERNIGTGRIPKGQGLTQRSLEHFYFWGCVDELRAARLLPRGYPIGNVTAHENLMSDYWYTPAGREVVRRYYFQDNERLPQYLTEAVLRERASRIPEITCLFGCTAHTIEQDERDVRVTVTGQGQQREVLAADYVVGCDGSRSVVREQAGIDLHRHDFNERMVLAVFYSRELHDGLKRFPERTTYRVLHPELEGYWRFFGRVDVGEGWFFHAPVRRDARPTNEDVHALLERAAGFSFSCSFEHVGLWDLRIDVANGYQEGRVLLAGDACHSHPPYGGFGLNTGLEDAANLGWKLAAVLQGWGGDELLRSYDEERRPVALQTTQSISAEIERDRVFLGRYSPARDRKEFERAWEEMASRSGKRLESYEPHYEGSSVVTGPRNGTCGIRGEHSFTARPGHHLAPQTLCNGKNVFEELGTGYTLLAFDAEDHAVRAFQRAAESLHVPLRVLRDAYEGTLTSYGSRLVLVRPDQYVAWTGDEPPRDVPQLMRKVAGAA